MAKNKPPPPAETLDAIRDLLIEWENARQRERIESEKDRLAVVSLRQEMATISKHLRAIRNSLAWLLLIAVLIFSFGFTIVVR